MEAKTNWKFAISQIGASLASKPIKTGLKPAKKTRPHIKTCRREHWFRNLKIMAKIKLLLQNHQVIKSWRGKIRNRLVLGDLTRYTTQEK